MEKTTYRTALNTIGTGCKQLAWCIYNTINTHRMLTALIISIALNIASAVIIFIKTADSRIAQTTTSHRLWELQKQNDSLRHADVKYYNYSYHDIK